MSTILFGGNPGYSLENVTEGTGSATSAHNVELTVDMATTIVNDNGTTRQIQRNEVILILHLFIQYIEKMNWPVVSS